jgi:hypothetical protein
MPGDDGSADEVLAALAASLRGELAESRAALARAVEELAQARGRIAELEARLRQTSRNSSRPPSGEGLDEPPPRPRSLRKTNGRKPGGQDAHGGSMLARAARPDREVRHKPSCCGRCRVGLAGQPVTGVGRRRVCGLPLVGVTAIEHQRAEKNPGRVPDQGRRPAGRWGAGAVRAADRRDQHVHADRVVPVQEADRAGAGRVVSISRFLREG